MNIVPLKLVVFLGAGWVFFSSAQAAPATEQASLSVTVNSFSDKTGSSFATCRNTLVNCLVTLYILPPNQGSVSITNTSNVPANNVTADLSVMGGRVMYVGQSSCTIEPQATCTLNFTTTPGADPQASTTVPVSGTNTGVINFNMQVEQNAP